MDLERTFAEHRAAIEEVAATLAAPCLRAAERIADCLKAGGKVLVCGNGGSAADAQHIAAELVNRFLLNRRPYAALALTTDSSILTSVGNDFTYDEIFEKQVQGLGRKGDVLIVLTTSGNSANILRAVRAANTMGLHTIGLLGGTGGKVAPEVGTALTVTSTATTARVQEAHIVLYHILCERVEELMEQRP